MAALLVRAATQRLVLLVPRGREHVGFEIRSLQEFLTARALVGGSDQTVIDRLQVLAASAHWRNPWLFAAGRLFAEREPLRDSVVMVLDHVDVSGPLARLWSPGAQLALDLVDDDIAANAPHHQRLLTQRAAVLIGKACGVAPGLVARVLFGVAEEDRMARSIVEDSLKVALAQGGETRWLTAELISQWADKTGGLASRLRQLGVAARREAGDWYRTLGRDGTPDALSEKERESFRKKLDTKGVGRPELAALRRLLRSNEPSMDDLEVIFGDKNMTDAISEAITDLRRDDWHTANAIVHRWIGYWFTRRTVAQFIPAVPGSVSNIVWLADQS